ncbi:MAG: hypothetical protein GT601_05805 [Acidaminobacter sp.]|uniref:hypothetical protein n=1 Tax=Acidaminobacter sp. TaxID=1872102 RepID=UPI00137E7690|nr:hypothetical protein [Acidaminobacter sp.]MZQ97170.1 hypothetical protein [Acidaminobacter sp.]
MYSNIKAELARMNIDHKQVAIMLEISSVSFTNKLYGRTPWRKSEIDFLIKFIGKDYSYLFFEDKLTDGTFLEE